MLKKNLSPNSLIISVCELLNEKRFVSNFGGNISVKTSSGNILITPANSSLVSITEDELVLTEKNGRVIMGNSEPSRELFMHLSIYNICEDMGGIIHTHTSLLSAYAQLGYEIKLTSPEAFEHLKKIPIIKHRSDETLIKELEKNIKKCSVIMIEGHGVISCGKNLIDAYNNIELAEDAARMNMQIEQLKFYNKPKSKGKKFKF